jgi:hypothetical protein
MVRLEVARMPFLMVHDDSPIFGVSLCRGSIGTDEYRNPQGVWAKNMRVFTIFSMHSNILGSGPKRWTRDLTRHRRPRTNSECRGFVRC